MNPVELGAGALAWLLAAGALSGAASLWAFRRWTDAGRLRAGVNQMLAHLMEFRLFTEEPLLILRAQRDLLRANGRLLRLIALPALLLSLPFAVLLVAAEAFFANAPLQRGAPAVITLQYAGEGRPEVQLQAPPRMTVETPAVDVPYRHQISWRVRPDGASGGQLQFQYGEHAITKSVWAAPGLHWLSGQRSGSLAAYLVHPSELPFSDPAIRWIRVQYPAARVFSMHWLVWFAAGTCAGALLSGGWKDLP